jgi:hypothetical protein
MITSKYEPLIKDLISRGVDFSRDVWQLTYSELDMYSELAKKYGYKKPVLHTRGFGFYMLLQKVNEKMFNL